MTMNDFKLGEVVDRLHVLLLDTIEKSPDMKFISQTYNGRTLHVMFEVATRRGIKRNICCKIRQTTDHNFACIKMAFYQDDKKTPMINFTLETFSEHEFDIVTRLMEITLFELI